MLVSVKGTWHLSRQNGFKWCHYIQVLVIWLLSRNNFIYITCFLWERRDLSMQEGLKCGYLVSWWLNTLARMKEIYLSKKYCKVSTLYLVSLVIKTLVMLICPWSPCDIFFIIITQICLIPRDDYISVNRMKIHWAVAKLAHFFILLTFEVDR